MKNSKGNKVVLESDAALALILKKNDPRDVLTINEAKAYYSRLKKKVR